MLGYKQATLWLHGLNITTTKRLTTKLLYTFSEKNLKWFITKVSL